MASYSAYRRRSHLASNEELVYESVQSQESDRDEFTFSEPSRRRLPSCQKQHLTSCQPARTEEKSTSGIKHSRPSLSAGVQRGEWTSSSDEEEVNMGPVQSEQLYRHRQPQEDSLPRGASSRSKCRPSADCKPMAKPPLKPKPTICRASSQLSGSRSGFEHTLCPSVSKVSQRRPTPVTTNTKVSDLRATASDHASTQSSLVSGVRHLARPQIASDSPGHRRPSLSTQNKTSSTVRSPSQPPDMRTRRLPRSPYSPSSQDCSHAKRPIPCSDPKQWDRIAHPGRTTSRTIPDAPISPSPRSVFDTVKKAAMPIVGRVCDSVSQQCVLPSNVSPGSLLVFDRAHGLYEHWAVYVGGGKVAHLTGGDMTHRPSLGQMVGCVAFGSTSPVICVSDIHEVAKGCVAVRIDDNQHEAYLGEPYPPQAVVQRALSQVGCNGYHVAVNNCEHYATWCKYGKGYSAQSDSDFKPLPLSCPSAVRRAECDKETQGHLATQRFDWVLVFSQQPSSDDGTHCSSRGAAQDLSINQSEALPEGTLRQAHSNDSSEIGTLGASNSSWLLVNRRSSCGKGTCGGRENAECEFLHVERSLEDSMKKVAAVVKTLRDRDRCPTKIIVQGGQIVLLHKPQRSSTPGTKFTCSSSLAAFKSVCRKNYRSTHRNVIVSVAFFCGYWLALWQRDRSAEDQSILLGKTFPLSSIKRRWQAGYTITTMAGGDHWIVVMDKRGTGPHGAQVIEFVHPGQPLPASAVKAHWRRGCILSHATGN